jgi:hypothetical protein
MTTKTTTTNTTGDPYLSLGGVLIPSATFTADPSTFTWNPTTAGTTTYNTSSVTMTTSALTWDNNLSPDSIDVQGKAVVHGTLTVDEDIKLGEISLKERLEKIEERLAIINRKPELEERWSKLRELGNEYRALEKDLIEKEYIWEVLKD